MSAPDTKPKNTAPVSKLDSIDWGDDIAEPDIEGWWDETLQKVLAGQIAGFKTIKTDNGVADVVIIKSLTPVKVKDDKGEPKDLPAGSAIGVFVKAKLMGLLEYVEHRCVVKLEALEKVKIKGGHTMWKYKVTPKKGSKIGAPPKSSILARTTDVAEDPDTDFP